MRALVIDDSRAVRRIIGNIMMVTTETEMDNISQAFLAGVNEYVMKPFDKNVILEKLQLLGIGA